MEFSRQEYWNGLPFPSPGALPDPGVKPRSPTFQADSLPFEPPEKPPHNSIYLVQFRSVSQSCLTLCNPMTAVRHTSLSITNFLNLLKLMSVESVMPPNHFILCRPLLLLPSIFPSIRVFSSQSVLCIRWPKYWSFSLSISPSNEYSELISFKIDWLVLLAVLEWVYPFSKGPFQSRNLHCRQILYQLSYWGSTN